MQRRKKDAEKINEGRRGKMRGRENRDEGSRGIREGRGERKIKKGIKEEKKSKGE